MRRQQKPMEVIYFNEKSYELLKQHFSLSPTFFDVNFHALKRCLWIQTHGSQASRTEHFDNFVKLAEFMSEFAVSFHNINFQIIYDFEGMRNKWFIVDANFAFNNAFNYYLMHFFKMSPCEEKLFAIDRYITLLYHQYKMYSLLDADQFKGQIENCLSGLSNFLAVETQLKEMGFALQSHADQSGHTLSYRGSGFFSALTIGSLKPSLIILESREKQFVQARRFQEALSVAKQIDRLLVANASQHDLPALNR